MLSTLRDEFRMARNRLLRKPGAVVVIVLALTLGVGPNLAAFQIVYGTLLRPLPYRDTEELKLVWQGVDSPPQRRLAVTSEVVNRLHEELDDEFEIAATQLWRTNIGARFDLIGGYQAQRLRGALASPNLFELLGVDALVGRALRPTDDSSVAVISHALWTQRFGGREDVVGTAINLTMGRIGRQSRPVTIVGVLPARFTFTYPEETEIWVSMPWQDIKRARREDYTVIARSKPAITLAQSETILAQPFAADARPPILWAESMHDYAVGRVRPLVWLLASVTGVLFLLACINVAGILLAQAVTRRREFAVQMALGATRVAVWRQLLLECLVLALIAIVTAATSIAVALPTLRSLLPATVPRSTEIAMGPASVFWTAVLLALVVGAAMIPSAIGSGFGAQLHFSDSGRTFAGSRTATRWRQILLGTQTAVVMVLAVCGGLLVKSFREIQSIDVGFSAREVIAINLQLMGARYATPEARQAFQSTLVERVEAIPAVASVGVTSSVPLRNSLDGRRKLQTADGVGVMANERQVDAGYFGVMGIPLKAGRLFVSSDIASEAPVAVVSERLATALFPQGNAIGQFLPLQVPAHIVGIVGDVRQTRVEDEPSLAYYVHRLQDPSELVSLVVKLKTTERSEGTIFGIRSIVSSCSTPNSQLTLSPPSTN